VATVNQVGTRKSDEPRKEILAERYRLIRKLSGGASGEVFLAEDLTDGRQWALKLVPENVEPAALVRLRAEFVRLTELSHPNIVHVNDAGVSATGSSAGRAFFVMEYVTGLTLAETLSSAVAAHRLEKFSLAAEALADALAYLHGQGVLHGDISPANIRCDNTGKPVLIDFGLAECKTSPESRSSFAASGTLGFLAPEALLGERGPAGDLFALGATLYDAWAGTPPFGVGLEAIRRIWQGPPPAPSSLHPGLPRELDRLLLRLIAPAVEDRPSSARELLREIRHQIPARPVSVEADLAVPFPVGDPLAGVVVGRSEEEAKLRRLFERLSEGTADASVVAVVGAPGSGRRTLIRRALRDARLAILSQSLAAFDIEERECSQLLAATAASFGVAGPVTEQEHANQASRETLARLISTLEEHSSSRPLCLVLAGSPEDESLATAVACNPPSGRLLVVLPSERAPEREGCLAITLGPLTRKSIAEIARRGAGVDPPATILNEIATTSGGQAGAVALLVRNWIGNLRDGRPHTLTLMDGDPDLGRLLDGSFATLTKAARAFVVATVLACEDCPPMHGLERMTAAAAEREAMSAGWLVPDSANLPSDLHWSALWRALARDEELRFVVRRASAALTDKDPRWAEIRHALGEDAKAAAAFWRGMLEATALGSWSRAVHLGRRAREIGPKTGAWADHLAFANALGVLGHYDEALALLDGCDGSSEAGAAAKLAERKAWLLGRRGDPEAAREIVEEALGRLEPGAEDSLLLRARLARMLVSSGRFAEAFAAVEPAIHVQSGAGLAARESAVLALAYGGKLGDAQELLGSLRSDTQDARDRSLAARAAALDGLVQQLAGRPTQAAEAYQSALKDYESARDLHGAANATFNLGCTLAETGNYTGAIDALERAIRDLGRLGAITDHALAVFNVGQLFLQLGDLESAGRSVRRLEDDAKASRVEAFQGYAWLLNAELQRKRRTTDCVGSYTRAGEIFTRLKMQAMAEVASLGRAECLAGQSAFAEARAILLKFEDHGGAAESGGDGSASPRAELVALARARVAIADSGTSDSAVLARADELSRFAGKAKVLGRRPTAWRMASLAAKLFARAGDSHKDTAQAFARSVFEEVKMNTPAKYWPGLESDVEAPASDDRRRNGKNDGTDVAELVERKSLLEGRLRRLLRINKRLNSDLRLSRVLETIIDTVIELTDAERGFLLLKDSDGDLVVKVARNIDQTSLEGPDFALSRSIAKQAADNGQPVITVDAAGDSRFSELLSVSDLHLRSVLAVPLIVKGDAVGTIYVDHRLRKGVFGDDELAMVMDFADQGAIAIENARLVSELRRREQQVQSLNRRLERELRVQEAALSDVRVELKESRQAAALRYDYRRIVGQAPSMLDLFRLLDRVTDTSLPVVIEGESGTGKELVARAIHFNGPRKDRAFVSENCAAIPETLLESTLFGHVRGAFTGADRDGRGLFAIADGGTLFLDEVAEMSAAMQGKLLRVLQNGEFHRVGGGERCEKVDVRILVATNKNLGQLVEEGKFRKDLFYRLSVVRLHLPPLRERREDIPLLVHHFLEKAGRPAAGTVAKGIDSAALAKLCGYSWPGNVRELENEIARAGAFAGAAVTVADLSAHIQTGNDPSEAMRSEPDSLRLRQRVERIERLLIREALTRVQGNQTKASALLGLSRFGLQKKLRRYNLEV
jgi:transcriptional regulator with GAF, ATPase, and Fis domain/tetratricopeptide (TPR) repeat protein